MDRLQIPDSFFEEEERGGFLIVSKMKRTWAAQMQVLHMIADVCSMYGLRFWADFGTLLGAVRHRGYIPWDDDIDIAMPRADYMKLIPLLRFELPPFVKINSIQLDHSYNMLSTFVATRANVDYGQSEEEAEITSFYFDCPYVTGVDIYPLDYCPRDPEQYSAWWELFGAVYYGAHGYDEIVEAGELSERLDRIESACGVTIPRGDGTRDFLWNLGDSLSQIYPKEEADSFIWTPEMATCSSERRRPLSCYEGTVNFPFELIEVPVPIGYAKTLRLRFGDDWANARNVGAAHDYPFYGPQEEYIIRMKTR